MKLIKLTFQGFSSAPASSVALGRALTMCFCENMFL